MPSTQVDTTLLYLTQIDIPADSREHDPEKLATLAQDMREQGQLQEIVVAQIGERYEVLAGAGRTQAARSLGWDKIRASVRHGVSEFDKARITFAENEDREDADAFYQAAQLDKMLNAKGCTQLELAKELGISEATVNAYQAVNKLPDEIKKLRRLSLGQLTQVARLSNNSKQIDLSKRCLNQDLSVRQVKSLVDKLLGKKTRASKHAAKKLPDVQWSGEEIIINRHFRPVEESLAEFMKWLSNTLEPMVIAMPGLKDSPKSTAALADAMEAHAAKANADAQDLVDQALAKMTPQQKEDLQKQFEKAQS